MKTLKQRLREKYLIEPMISEKRIRFYEPEIIEIVKEWLTQKRQEYLTQKDWELTATQILTELLEELK